MIDKSKLKPIDWSKANIENMTYTASTNNYYIDMQLTDTIESKINSDTKSSTVDGTIDSRNLNDSL